MIIIKEKSNIEDLVNKGYGIETDEGLILNDLEVAYIFERFGEFELSNYADEFRSIHDKVTSERVEEFLVFKDLREKGYIVRCGLDGRFLRVYRKGFRRGEDRTLYIVKVFKVNQDMNVNEVLEDLFISGKMRKELIYAIVGDRIEYISLTRRNFN